MKGRKMNAQHANKAMSDKDDKRMPRKTGGRIPTVSAPLSSARHGTPPKGHKTTG